MPDIPDTSGASASEARAATSFASMKTSQLALIFAVCLCEGMDTAVLGSTFKVLETDMGLTPTALALMTMIQVFSLNAAAPLWGYMCDNGLANRKDLMMIGCFGWGVAMLSLGLCNSLWQVLVLRALNGVFLACLVPLSQSWVADLAAANCRGQVFGLLGAAEQIGVGITSGVTTTVSAAIIFGMRGWRSMCFGITILSWALCATLKQWMDQPSTVEQPLEGSVLCVITKTIGNLGMHLQIPTFNLLILQGIAGNMPWLAMNFEIMYLQYLGFSNAEVGLMVGVMTIFTALGPLLGGAIGDALESRSPNHGRIITAQVSVLIGIPSAVVFLVVLPDTVGSTVIWPYYVCKAFFHLTATWPSYSTNRPVLCEVVHENHRATIIAWQTAMENGLSALICMPLMGFLSESVFGYHPSNQDVADMAPEARVANAVALRSAMLYMTVLPWLLCFAGFSFMHWTYPHDRKATLGSAGEDPELATLIGGKHQ